MARVTIRGDADFVYVRGDLEADFSTVGLEEGGYGLFLAFSDGTVIKAKNIEGLKVGNSNLVCDLDVVHRGISVCRFEPGGYSQDSGVYSDFLTITGPLAWVVAGELYDF